MKAPVYGGQPLKATDTANSIDRTISVAPMMGYTDRHCRALLRLISPHSLLFSEMIVSGALIHGDAQHFLQHGADEPCVLQIGGSQPAELAICAKLVEDAGYQEINLNVGCPSDRVQYGGIGACLMAEPELVAECVNAMQSAVEIPVSVKCRIGIDNNESYDYFHHFIDVVAASSCELFYIHARNAILKGLSPKENREIPPLKYDYVYKIAKDFPQNQFFINGGLRSCDEVLSQLEQVEGVMLGRAPYSNPYLLAELEQSIYGYTAYSRREVVDRYVEYANYALEKGHHPKHLLKHLLGLFAGRPGARQFRRYLSDHMFAADCSIKLVYDALKASGLD